MRALINGRWEPYYQPSDDEYQAIAASAFHDRIDVRGPFKPAAQRYHLYASYACPFAQRALIGRALANLDDCVGVSILHPRMGAQGWTFDRNFDGTTGDRLGGRRTLYELYLDAAPRFSGRVTTPVLWDRQTRHIVSNNSAQIQRIFARDFQGLITPRYPLAAAETEADLDVRISEGLCSGVYRAGFARTQEAYESALAVVVAVLDEVEYRLGATPFLGGSDAGETDVKLFCTLVRWDVVYAVQMKCGRRRLADLPNCYSFLRRMARLPGVAGTVHMDHIRRHYFDDWPEYNHAIVPYRHADDGEFLTH